MNTHLHQRAQELIIEGRLPIGLPILLWTRLSTGDACSLCDQPIEGGQVQYEMETEGAQGARRYHFHQACHAAWVDCRPWQREGREIAHQPIFMNKSAPNSTSGLIGESYRMKLPVLTWARLGRLSGTLMMDFRGAKPHVGRSGNTFYIPRDAAHRDYATAGAGRLISVTFVLVG